MTTLIVTIPTGQFILFCFLVLVAGIILGLFAAAILVPRVNKIIEKERDEVTRISQDVDHKLKILP